MSESEQTPSKPHFKCEECGHTEPIPVGEQFLNPMLQSCKNCGESGLEMVR